jgi:mono/diheme cytochrome c family protein
MRAMVRGRAWLVLGVVALLTACAARAENLDEGKSGPRLFADSCAACHRGARGLSKGRFRVTLYLYLQQHYASNSSSAWELASYLAAIDDASRVRARAGAPKHATTLASKSGASPRPRARPPAPIPNR